MTPETIETYLEHPDAATRRWAVQRLSWDAPRRLAPHLEALLAEDIAAMRLVLADALDEIPLDVAVPAEALWSITDQESVPPRMRLSALQALLKRGLIGARFPWSECLERLSESAWVIEGVRAWRERDPEGVAAARDLPDVIEHVRRALTVGADELRDFIELPPERLAMNALYMHLGVFESVLLLRERPGLDDFDAILASIDEAVFAAWEDGESQVLERRWSELGGGDPLADAVMRCYSTMEDPALDLMALALILERMACSLNEEAIRELSFADLLHRWWLGGEAGRVALEPHLIARFADDDREVLYGWFEDASLIGDPILPLMFTLDAAHFCERAILNDDFEVLTEYELWTAFNEELLKRPELLRDISAHLGALLEEEQTSALVLLDLLDMISAREPWVPEVVLGAMPVDAESSLYGDFLLTVQRLGLTSALPRLREAYTFGDQALASCVLQLAHLDGSADELPEELRAEARTQAELMDSESILFMGGERFPLKVICTACGAGGIHPVETLYMDFDGEYPESFEEYERSLMPAQILTCERCDTPDAYRYIEDNIRRALQWASIGTFMSGDARLVPYSVESEALRTGAGLTRPSEMIARFQAILEDDPSNAEAWRRLGNVYEKFVGVEEALEAWERALEVSPSELLAAIYIVMHYEDDADLMGYFDAMREALRRVPSALEAEGRVPEVVEAIDYFSESFIPLLEHVGVHWSLHARWARKQGVINLRDIVRWASFTDWLLNGGVIELELQDLPTSTPDPVLMGLMGDRQRKRRSLKRRKKKKGKKKRR